MSLERKIRRNIRQQQRKALRKYIRAKEQKLNAKRKPETQQIVYSTSPGKTWSVTEKAVSGFESKITRLDNPDSQGQTITDA